MSAEAVLGLHPMPYRAEPHTARLKTIRRPHHSGGVNYPAIDALCDQMAGVCGAAVDPLEIAAALEFEGVTDRVAHKDFGLPDVFSLAEEMYRRVPRRPAEPVAAPDAFGHGVRRSLLRGLLYGLPAVCFPAATRLLSGRSAIIVLLVSMLLAWSLTQGLAYLGHLRLGWLRHAAARRVLRAGLAAGTAMTLLALAVIALLVPAAAGTLAFGAGQAAYMLSGCVLMVLGIERLLIGVLAPAVLGATAFLALGRPPQLEPVLWVALAATPLLAVALAWHHTRSAGSGDNSDKRSLVATSEWRPVLQRLVFGLLAPTLVVLPVVLGVPRSQGAYLAVALAAVPLSLSMGAAEWSLSWYRRATQKLLRATDCLNQFGRRARHALLCAVGVYLAWAAALTGVAVAIGGLTGIAAPDQAATAVLLAFLAFGGGMFLSLLLHAFERGGITLIASGAALLFQFLFATWHGAQLVANTGFFIALTVYATVVLGRAAAHG